MRMCTSFAPAVRSISTILRLVVPRTMESSTRISRLPRTLRVSALSLVRTPSSRMPCSGWMNVRPT